MAPPTGTSRTGGPPTSPSFADAIRHFSQMGYVAVAFIALTGAINSLLLVGSLRGMLGTSYAGCSR